MHFTKIITKDKKEYIGWLKEWCPEENIIILDLNPGLIKLSFDDLISATTQGSRTSNDLFITEDEIERARKHMKEGREKGWFKDEFDVVKDISLMEWEKR